MAGFLDNFLMGMAQGNRGLADAGVPVPDNAVQPPAQVPAAEAAGPDLTVMGNRANPNIVNTRVDPVVVERVPTDIPVQPIQMATQDHRGMFGTRGTLRDILGLLGDSWSVANGRDPRYRQRRDLELQQDAMAQFPTNPLAAIRQMGATASPEMANTMYNNYQEAEARRANNDSLEASRSAQAAYRQGQLANQYASAAARMLASAPTAEMRQRALTAVQQRLRAQNMELEDIGLTEGADDNMLTSYARGDMSSYQHGNLEVAQKNARSNQTRAEAAVTSANRPRGGGGGGGSPVTAQQAYIASRMGQVGWDGLTPAEQDMARALGVSIYRQQPRSGGAFNPFSSGGVSAQRPVDRATNNAPSDRMGKGTTRRAVPPPPPGFRR